VAVLPHHSISHPNNFHLPTSRTSQATLILLPLSLRYFVSFLSPFTLLKRAHLLFPLVVSKSKMFFSTIAVAALAAFATASPVKRDFSGRATYYATGLGACGDWNNDNDFIVAMNSQQ
jgi:hypothetical protein